MYEEHPESLNFAEEVVERAVDIDEEELLELAGEYGLRAHPFYNDPDDVLVKDFVSDLESGIRRASIGIVNNFGWTCPACGSQTERDGESLSCTNCTTTFTVEGEASDIPKPSVESEV